MHRKEGNISLQRKHKELTPMEIILHLCKVCANVQEYNYLLKKKV